MKTIGLAAILAVTSTAAFAGGFQFSIDGGTVSIDLDERCSDRLCASVSWQERGSRESRKFRLPEVSTKTISKYIDVPQPRWNSTPVDEDDGGVSAEPSPERSAGNREAPENDESASAPDAERAPPAPTIAPPLRKVSEPAAPPAAFEPTPPSRRVATRRPVRAAAPPAPASDPDIAPAGVHASGGESAPAPSAEGQPRPQRTKVANVAPSSAVDAAAKPSRPTPVGEWLVEDGEGKIRIEECGTNMCGYVSAAKNPNEKDRHNPNPALRNRSVIGTPILINMKPDGKRWSGRIYNVKDGKSYTAHISLKNTDTLRIEGCAFGGMICGGQNWSRAD